MIWVCWVIFLQAVTWIPTCASRKICSGTVEKLLDLPAGWSTGGPAELSTNLTLRLEIKSPGTSTLETSVLQVSTPGHPRYGKHMKRDEVADLLRPDPSVLDMVLTWLSTEGVSEETLYIRGNWIAFQATVSQVERLLRTQFFYYHSVTSQRSLVRTLEYSVPCEILPHVLSIQPTTRFGGVQAQKGRNLSKRAGLPLDQPIVATAKDLVAECGIVMRPDCLRSLYGLEGRVASPDTRNRLGVSGFLDQYARHADFHDFMHHFSADASCSGFEVVFSNGGMNPENSSASSTEASLDIQYAAALAHGNPVTFYTTAGRAPSVSPAALSAQPFRPRAPCGAYHFIWRD